MQQQQMIQNSSVGFNSNLSYKTAKPNMTNSKHQKSASIQNIQQIKQQIYPQNSASAVNHQMQQKNQLNQQKMMKQDAKIN